MREAPDKEQPDDQQRLDDFIASYRVNDRARADAEDLQRKREEKESAMEKRD